VFVYLAQPGHARAGPPPAVVRYEAIAEHYAIPSIDCTAYVEQLVERGEASWTGERALTIDGVHYGELARDLVGQPFAAALLALIDASRGPFVERTSDPDLRFATTALRPARAAISAGEWVVGIPADHDVRMADAYVEGTVVQCVAPGGTLSCAFVGHFFMLWASGVGAIEIDTLLDGAERNQYTLRFTKQHEWHPLAFRFARQMPVVATITVREGPVRFGDIYVAGTFTA
jgi:hypothetical protein